MRVTDRQVLIRDRVDLVELRAVSRYDQVHATSDRCPGSIVRERSHAVHEVSCPISASGPWDYKVLDRVQGRLQVYFLHLRILQRERATTSQVGCVVCNTQVKVVGCRLRLARAKDEVRLFPIDGFPHRCFFGLIGHGW